MPLLREDLPAQQLRQQAQPAQEPVGRSMFRANRLLRRDEVLIMHRGTKLGASLRDRALPGLAPSPSRQMASRPDGNDPSRIGYAPLRRVESLAIALGPAALRLLRARRCARLRRRQGLAGASRPRQGAGSLRPRSSSGRKLAAASPTASSHGGFARSAVAGSARDEPSYPIPLAVACLPVTDR